MTGEQPRAWTHEMVVEFGKEQYWRGFEHGRAEAVVEIERRRAELREASRPVGVSPGADLAIDPDPCLFSWGGCEETYHGGHECHRGGAHKGRHQCLCGATSVRQQEDKASRPVS